MSHQKLIDLLQNDLKNERKHMFFYMHAGVMVQGLHREEMSEFLLKEAQDEHQHVIEFSQIICQLGGVPNLEINEFSTDLVCPYQILKYAQEMEQEVANTYSDRLAELSSREDGDNSVDRGIQSYVELFYEDQLQDSQKTALELRMFIKPYLKQNSCVGNC